MLSVSFVECHIRALYAQCHYAECRDLECRYAEGRGARKTFTAPVYQSGVTVSVLIYVYFLSLTWKHKTRLKILARSKRYSLL